MRWLHLTDLHWGVAHEQQEVAAAALLSAIKERSSSKFDAVFITGDIAYAGLQEQYARFASDFLLPLKDLDCVGDALIIAVPGNHDVNCEIGTNITWDGIGQYRQDRFFNFGNEGREIRSGRIRNFEAYIDFVDCNSIVSPNLWSGPAELFEVPSIPSVRFVCLNTCFFSDRHVSDEHKTPAPVHPLRYLTRDLTDDAQIIVLGHYPITRFSPRTRIQFRSALLQLGAVYLHGHDHELDALFEASGVISIGFGASYLSPFTSQPVAYYRNSFAICEIDEALHVAPYSWDQENGRWISEAQLPPSFNTSSATIENGFVLATSRTPDSTRQHIHEPDHLTPVQKSRRLREAIWLSENHVVAWRQILEALNLIGRIDSVTSLPQDSHGRSYSQFVVRDKSGQHLVRTVSAIGDILSAKLVEETNTTIDTKSLDSAIVLTIGSVSEDARTLADQLQRNNKPIRILDGAEINHRISTVYLSKQLEKIASSWGTEISIRPLFLERGIGLVLTDTLSENWFSIIEPSGNPEPSTSQNVYEIREKLDSYKHLAYREETKPYSSDGSAHPAEAGGRKFDVENYKQKCFEIHDDIQYPGLAAIGLQIPNKSVRQLYVAARADTVVSDIEQESITIAVSDAVNALDMSSEQRSELHRALTAQYGASETAEYGAANEMYELKGNILVEGDPGSGKSLFVRNAILNYCEPEGGKVTWYSNHVPVFLPLVQVGSLKRRIESLIGACAEYARTTRLDLYEEDLENLASAGRIAFFFDGLDEVADIEERSAFMGEISELIERYGPLGNRFVLNIAAGGRSYSRRPGSSCAIELARSNRR